MNRRITALVLCAVMVWGAAVPALAQSPFPDVPEDHWAYDAVSRLAQAGLIEGYPDGTFGGSRTFTRYEMAMVFDRMLANLEGYLADAVEREVTGQNTEMAEQIQHAIDQATRALATAIESQALAADAKGIASEAERVAAQALALAAERAAEIAELTVAQLTEEIATEVAANQAAEVAQAVAQQVAAQVAESVAAQIAASFAEEAVEAAAAVAAQTAAEVATKFAVQTANDVAEAVAADIASQVAAAIAAEIAGEVANNVAAAAAADVAAQVASDVAANTAAEVAAGIASGIATEVATGFGAEIAAKVAESIVKSNLGEAPLLDLDVVTEVATEVASAVAESVAAEAARTVALEVTQAVAHQVAAQVASEIAQALAAEVAAETAQGVVEALAAEIALNTAREAARAVAQETAASIAAATAAEVAARVTNEIVAQLIESLTATQGLDPEIVEMVQKSLQTVALAEEAARAAAQSAEEARRAVDEIREIALGSTEEAITLAEQAQDEAGRALRAAQQAVALAEEAVSASEAGSAEAKALAQDALRAAQEAVALAHEVSVALAKLQGEVAEIAERPVFTLTDDAEIAIAAVASNLYDERLAELAAQADEIAAAVVALADQAITADEAQQIAERIVAVELSSVIGEVGTLGNALNAVRGDLAATEALLLEETGRLEKQIVSLTEEFHLELEALRVLEVRVSDLERWVTEIDGRLAAAEERIEGLDDRVTSAEGKLDELDGRLTGAEGEIDAIRTRLDRFTLSGANTTVIVRGHGPSNALLDPRDPDQGELDLPAGGAEWGNVLNLQARFIPADGVVARIGADFILFSDYIVHQQGSLRDILTLSGFFAELETPHDINYVRLGSLDEEVVAEGFSSYLVDEDGLNDVGEYGLYAERNHDQLRVFLLQDFDTGIYTTGLSHYAQTADNAALLLNAVRTWNGSNSRTGLAGTLSGGVSGIEYSGTVVLDLEKMANVVHANVDVPVLGGQLNASYDAIDAVWATNDRLPASREIEGPQPGEMPNGDSPVKADQSRLQVRLDVPVQDFWVWGQVGRHSTSVTNGEYGQFTRLGLSGLDLYSLEVGALHERITDQNDDLTLHNHVTLGVPLGEWRADVEVHRRTLPADTESHQLLRIGGPINLQLPLEAEAHFGTSQTGNEREHISYELRLADYQVLPQVKVSASLGAANNALADDDWYANSSWTDEDRFHRSIDAEWSPYDALRLSAGLSVIDSTTAQSTLTRKAGVEYQTNIFDGDLLLGYRYQDVWLRDLNQRDGTPENTFLAQYRRALGSGQFIAGGKYSIGGTTSTPGNERDFVGNVSLLYPIYESASFILDGHFVSSQGTKSTAYEAHRVMAGLHVEF